eukprot:SAG22_NODE_2274_length_2765_cov_5.855214_2_plen_107_part_00
MYEAVPTRSSSSSSDSRADRLKYKRECDERETAERLKAELEAKQTSGDARARRAARRRDVNYLAMYNTTLDYLHYSDPDLYEIKVRDAAENDLYVAPGVRPTDVEL